MNHYSTTKPHLRILIISIILATIFVTPVAAINNNDHIIDQITKNNYQPVKVYNDDLYYTTTPTLTHILEYTFIKKSELTISSNYNVYLNLAGHEWVDNKEPITFTIPIDPTDTPTKLTPNEIAKQIITDITTNTKSLPDNLLIEKSVGYPTYGLFIDIAKLKQLYPEIQTLEFKWISTNIYPDVYHNTIWGPTYYPNHFSRTNNNHIIDQITKNNYQPVKVYNDNLYYTTTPTLTHILEYPFIEKSELAANLNYNVYINLVRHRWVINREPITFTRQINPTDTPTKLTPKEIAKQFITDITTNTNSLPDNLLIYNAEDHPYGLFIDIGKLKELYPEIQTREFKWISTSTTDFNEIWNIIWGPTYHPDHLSHTNNYLIDQITKNNYQPVEIYNNVFYYTTTPTLTHILEYPFIEKSELAANPTYNVYLNLVGHDLNDNNEQITVTRRINPTDTPTKLTPNEIAKQIITDIATNTNSLPDNLLIYNTEDHSYGLFIDIAKLKQLCPEIHEFKWINTHTISKNTDFLFATWNTIWGPTYHPNHLSHTNNYLIDQITKNNYQPVELYNGYLYYTTTPTLTHILEYPFIEKSKLAANPTYNVYLNLAGHGWLDNNEPITVTRRINPTDTPTKLTPKEIAKQFITDITTNTNSLPDNLLIEKSADYPTYGLFIDIGKLKQLCPEIQTREFKRISTYSKTKIWNTIWGPTYHPNHLTRTNHPYIPNKNLTTKHLMDQIIKNNYQPIEIYNNVFYYTTTPTLTHILEYPFIEKSELTANPTYNVRLNLAGHGWIKNNEPITVTRQINPTDTPTNLTPNEIAKQFITDITTNKTSLPDNLLIEKSVGYPTYGLFIDIAKLKQLYPEIQTREFKWIDIIQPNENYCHNRIWGPTYHPNYTPPTPIKPTS
jgi:hypothetical protein